MDASRPPVPPDRICKRAIYFSGKTLIAQERTSNKISSRSVSKIRKTPTRKLATDGSRGSVLRPVSGNQDRTYTRRNGSSTQKVVSRNLRVEFFLFNDGFNIDFYYLARSQSLIFFLFLSNFRSVPFILSFVSFFFRSYS